MENETREIKFRAWDRFRNEMQEVVAIDWKIHIIEFKNGSDCLSGDVELMQFTGLKDRNENEIYKGDIVEWDEGEVEHSPKDEGVIKRGLIVKEGISFLIENEDYHKTNRVLDKSKIIGNIHKNPDLLEGGTMKDTIKNLEHKYRTSKNDRHKFFLKTKLQTLKYVLEALDECKMNTHNIMVKEFKEELKQKITGEKDV